MSDRVDDLEREIREVRDLVMENRATLIGIGGLGGILRRLEQLGERTHSLATAVTGVQSGLELMQQDIQFLISEVRGGR